jgi:hypothetical protein
MDPEEEQQAPEEVEVEDEVEEEEEYESDDTWESDVESEAEIAEIMQLDIAEESANTGKKEYLAKCASAPSIPHTAHSSSARHRTPRHAHIDPCELLASAVVLIS